MQALALGVGRAADDLHDQLGDFPRRLAGAERGGLRVGERLAGADLGDADGEHAASAGAPGDCAGDNGVPVGGVGERLVDGGLQAGGDGVPLQLAADHVPALRTVGRSTRYTRDRDRRCDGFHVATNMSTRYRPVRPFSNNSPTSGYEIVTPCRTNCCTPAGNRQSCPAAALAISHASSPIASAAPSGGSSPNWAVTDHVPGSLSARERSLQRGHLPPSVRTSSRLLSTRYAPVTSGVPSTFTSTMECTGAGSRASDTTEHAQSVHDPHVRLNHWPPISAGCGYDR